MLDGLSCSVHDGYKILNLAGTGNAPCHHWIQEFEPKSLGLCTWKRQWLDFVERLRVNRQFRSMACLMQDTYYLPPFAIAGPLEYVFKGASRALGPSHFFPVSAHFSSLFWTRASRAFWTVALDICSMHTGCVHGICPVWVHGEQDTSLCRQVRPTGPHCLAAAGPNKTRPGHPKKPARCMGPESLPMTI